MIGTVARDVFLSGRWAFVRLLGSIRCCQRPVVVSNSFQRVLVFYPGVIDGRDLEVRYTGRRPGERLHEMLSIVPLIPSIHPRISIADQGFPGPVVLMGAVTGLIRLARFDHKDRLREALLAIAKSTWEEDGLHTEELEFVIDLRKVGLTETAVGLEAS